MNLSRKFLVMLFITLLCLTFTGVYAQQSTITSVNSPTTANLNSVFVVSNETTNNNDLTRLDAWAVGDGGVIAKWNGSAWATMNSPTTANLYKVIFLNATYGWAVGGNQTNGVILQYNGTWSVWRSITNGGPNTTGQDAINATLYSITMDHSGMIGWVVGANGTIYGWNGEECFAVPSGTNATLRGVGMINNGSTAWAVGDNGTIITWSSTTNTWMRQNSPTNATLYSIEIVNATLGWAVGGNQTNGVILALNGTQWTAFNRVSFGAATATDRVNVTLYSLSINNATSAWAVGGNGTVLYWGGTQWDGQSGATNVDLKGVSMVHGNFTSIGQAWAVGNGGRILAWVGSIWIPEIPMLAIPVLLSIGFVIVLLGKTRLFRRTPLF